MRKIDLTILLLVLLFVGGMLYMEYAVPKLPKLMHGPAIRIVQKEYDTTELLKIKYKTLHDTEIQIQTKYETLFVRHRGDTTCATTRRIIAMHRFIDSCSK
jgi:hypothetical protein